jgi:hypothetical protein
VSLRSSEEAGAADKVRVQELEGKLLVLRQQMEVEVGGNPAEGSDAYARKFAELLEEHEDLLILLATYELDQNKGAEEAHVDAHINAHTHTHTHTGSSEWAEQGQPLAHALSSHGVPQYDHAKLVVDTDTVDLS